MVSCPCRSSATRVGVSLRTPLSRRIPPTALVALAWLTQTSPVAAQHDAFSVTWTAPTGCPDGAHVEAAVRAMLRRDVPSGEARVVAQVTPTATGTWHAELTTDTRGRRGTRSLDAPTCAALADAVAVIVAWTLDPTALTASEAPRDVPAAPVVTATGASSATSAPPASATTTAVTPDATAAATSAAVVPVAPPSPLSPLSPPSPLSPTAPRPTAPRAPRWRFTTGVAARFDVGALPGFAVAPELWLALTRGRWNVSLDGSWTPFARETLPASERTGGDFSRWTVGLRVCHRWRGRVVTPSLCAGGEGGRVTATGFGVALPDTVAEPWAALLAGAALDVALGSRVSVVVGVDGEVALVRPSYVLRGVATVYQSAPVTLRTRIGVALHF